MHLFVVPLLSQGNALTFPFVQPKDHLLYFPCSSFILPCSTPPYITVDIRLSRPASITLECILGLMCRVLSIVYIFKVTYLYFSVTVPGYQGSSLLAPVTFSTNMAAWERFNIEFVLTFVVVLVYLVCMDTYRKWLPTSCLTIGATYSTCTFVLVRNILNTFMLFQSLKKNKKKSWI